MTVNNCVKLVACLVITFLFSFAGIRPANAVGQYLVGDRTLGRVLRYSENGTFLGTLLNDPSLGTGTGTNDGGLTGLTLSPDQSRLLVSDRLSNRVAVYSYDGLSASHLYDITAAGAYPSTLYLPTGVLYSQDASTIYVANLGPFNQFQLPAGDTVGHMTPGGSSVGPDLVGGPQEGRTGLAFASNGDLLVSSFGVVGSGSVLRFDASTGQYLGHFITPRPELRGAANLLRVGSDLYVAAGYGGRVGKFSAIDGTLDTSFGANGYIGPDANFAFPASLALGPDGSSILVGVLGSTTGDSRIDRYDFTGALIGGGPWANNTTATKFPNGTDNPPGNIILGFTEPTAIVFSSLVPEPSSAMLGMIGVIAIGAVRRRK
jgi:sugar lactone lactonase YvrE